MDNTCGRWLVLIASVFVFPVLADEPQAYRLEIERQPLVAVLKELSTQTGLQVVGPIGDDSSQIDRIVGPLKGEYSAERVLAELRAQCDLVFTQINERTIAVTSRSEASRKSHTRAAFKPIADVQVVNEHEYVAAAPQPQIGSGLDRGFGDARSELPASDRSEPQEEVVVTGSHIRGSTVAGSKLITIDRTDIKESGYGRIQDVIESVPQNFTGVGEDFNQSSVSNVNYGSEIQLRGLGAGTTLTLVNGHRAPGGGSLGAFTDISSIPAAAIERVEILADGASAIYGSDAIGGVVNIVLRKDFDGAETSMRYGTYDGDADEAELSQIFGRRWQSGSVLLGYQYTGREPLLYGSRPYAAGGADFTPFGGTDRRRDSSVRRGGSPGNILNSAGQVAFAIPAGQDGTALTAAQLLPGVINYPDASYGHILPDQEMHSAFASLSQQLGSRVELNFDARYSMRDMHQVTLGNNLVVSVPSNNPFYVNPFGGTAPVRVEYDFSRDIGGITADGTVRTAAANLGSLIDIGHDWRLSLSGSFGEEHSEWDRYRVNSTEVAAALNDSSRVTALNVFGNGTANNPATLARIRLHEFDDTKNRSWSAEAIADGPLFALPGGVSKLAAGTAYHRDTLEIVSNFSAPVPTDSERDSVAAFAELTLPLIGADQQIPLVRELQVFVAGRYDDYKDFGETFNPKIGLTWSLVQSLKLRGTWGTSFRAPPFYLSNTDIRRPSRSTVTVADPRSPTGQTSTLQVAGVVRDLTEEEAEVWSAGLDFAPIDALELSATYFDVFYDGRIGSPFSSLALALANDQRFADTGLVIRNPTRAQIDAFCASPDFVGNCAATYGAIVDNRRRNIAVTQVKGIDADVHYHLNTAIGSIRLGAGGAYLLEYQEAITDRSPALNVVDTFQKPPRLRLRGTGAWTSGGWSATAAVNYLGSYKTGLTPTTKIDSWTTVDVGLGYSFEASGWHFLEGTNIRFGANNVFNKEPPFVNIDVGPGGYDTANTNIIGRNASLQVEKKW